MKAYVLGRITSTNELKVKDNLEKQDYVEKAELIYGSFDVILKVNIKDVDELKNTIVKNLTENFDIGPEVQTFVVMEKFPEQTPES